MLKNINQFLKFEPILKEKVWGGDKLISQLNKKSNSKKIGESWEISAIDNDVSVVTNGDLKNKKIDYLINEFTSSFLGEKVYKRFGEKFPLLLKFIDAKKRLSLQVHPDNEIALKRHNCFGKTEMWYVLDADKNSNLIIGFSKEINKSELKEIVTKDSLLSVLNVEYVSSGDSYLVPPGCIHAIGGGVLLAEIQETSDITYRIYDWNRKDLDGNLRELHTDLALETIDFSTQQDNKLKYDRLENTPSTIVDCKYFTTNFLYLNKRVSIDNSNKDSFVVYMCVNGAVNFILDDNTEKISKGETILVPACLKYFDITPETKSELLEIFIK